MKKFTSALLAVTALSAAVAMADAPVASATGFYLGGNVGAANTNVKYGFTNVGSSATASGPGAMAPGATVTSGSLNAQTFSAQTGAWNALFGLFAGYGMQMNQMYVGAEIYGGFDGSKVNAYDDSGSGNGSATGGGAGAYYPLGKASVKRTSFYGLAPRVGFFATPSTLMYVKVGIEGGKWEASKTSSSTDQYSVARNVTTKSNKNAVSFVPAVGFDMFLNKNVFLRAEYSYMFGPKITVKQDTTASGSWGGTYANHTFNVTQQVFKFGVGYKF